MFKQRFSAILAGITMVAATLVGGVATPAAGATSVAPPSAISVQAGDQLAPQSTPPKPTKQDKKQLDTKKGLPKGLPTADGASTFAACGLCYYYAGAIRNPGGGATADGMSVNMGIHKPVKDGLAYHTLGEITMQKDIGGQMNAVEVGWTVDPGLNNNSSDPHLFVGAWRAGAFLGYNSGGWVDYNPTTMDAGDSVLAHVGTQKWVGITYSAGNWWVRYNNEWIGYFPGSVWSNNGVIGFTNSTYQQAFGEVAASDTATTTDMGNGVLATATAGARMGSLNIIPTGGTNGLATYTGSYATAPTRWAFAFLSGSSSSFNHGGPS